MINVGTAVGYLDLDLSGWTRGLESARAGMKQFIGDGESFSDRMAGLGTTLTATGKSLTPLTAGLVGVGAAAIKVGMEFEQSMAEVKAISGATEEEFQLLEDTAREFGKSTQFSASEAAQALKYMALAGWDANTSSEALGGVLSLAAAAGMDLASASDMVTDYMSAFGIEAQNSAYFADALAYAQSHANTNVEQLGEAFKNSAAFVHAMGQDFETATAVLEAFANQGLKGSEAGTQLKAIMRDISQNMEEGAIAIGDVNVQVADQQGNFRDLTDILKDIEAATGSMSETERSAALQTTFTSESMSGLSMVLMEGVDNITQYEEELRAAGGAAEDMADTMTDTGTGSMKEFQSALEEAAIAISKELVPQVTSMIRTATDWVNKFNDMDDETKKTIVTIGKVVAAIGPALIIGGKFASSISSISSAARIVIPLITKIGPLIAGLSNPITIVIGVVAALVAAWQTNFLGIRDITDNVIKSVKKAWDSFVQTAPEIPKMFVDGLVNGFKSAGGAVVKAVTDLGSSMFSGLLKAIDAHSPSKKAALAGQYWDEGLAQGLYEGMPLVEDGMEYLANLLERAGDDIQSTFVQTTDETGDKVYSSIYANSMRVLSVYSQERDARISAMKEATDANVAQLDREISATENAYKIKMNLLQQELSARQALIDTQTNEEIEALQAQIDAIDELNEAEQRAEEEADYNDKIAKKMEEIELAEDEVELTKLQNELDKIIADRQKKLLQQSRADEQKALREQINEAYKRANERKAALQEEYDAKILQLEQQREAEIKFMQELQTLMKQDLELRKELAETQQKIATQQERLKTSNLSAEERKQTQNEITELRKREAEIKQSMDKNKKTFEDFTPKLKDIGLQYGNVLSTGIKSTENVITNYMDSMLSQANAVISAMGRAENAAYAAAEAAREAAREQEALAAATAEAETASISTGNLVPIANTYNFYSNEKMTPAEISRQFKKTQQDLALGF